MRCFVSCAHADRDFAVRSLVPVLEDLRIEYFFYERDIHGGENWRDKLRFALLSCPLFVVVVSAAAKESEHVLFEVTWALEHRQRSIVPVIVDSTDLADIHMSLQEIQAVDFRGDATRALRRFWEAMREMDRLHTGRALAFEGDWHGTVSHESPMPSYAKSYGADLTLCWSDGGLIGQMLIKVQKDGRTNEFAFTVTGDAVFDRFVRLSYVFHRPTREQCGCFFLRLHENGRQLNGRVIGWGPEDPDVFVADGHFEKSDTK